MAMASKAKNTRGHTASAVHSKGGMVSEARHAT
jgi:hypothetical protein